MPLTFSFPSFVYIGALYVDIKSTFTSSLTISWTLDDTLTATSYTISYSNTNTDCFIDSNNIIDISGTMYTLTDLQEATEYSITVTAILDDRVTTKLSDRNTAEASITATTLVSG